MSKNRTHAEIVADDAKILALRNEGLLCREIADKLDVPEHIVWTCMQRHNIAVRGPRSFAVPDSPAGQIRAARAATGLSVEELAERAGVSASQVKKLERGVVPGSARTLRPLRAVLGIPEADPGPRVPREAFSVTEHDGVIRVLLSAKSQRGPALAALRALGGVVM